MRRLAVLDEPGERCVAGDADHRDTAAHGTACRSCVHIDCTVDMMRALAP
jgi:hypothetical protein